MVLYRDRKEDQWNRIEEPEMNLRTYLYLTKELKPSSGKKTAVLTNGAGSTGGQHVEECKWIHSSRTKFKSKWIKDLHIKPDTLKRIEEKVGEEPQAHGHRGNFPEQNTKDLALKPVIDKWDLI